jgi:hypothetical protein
MGMLPMCADFGTNNTKRYAAHAAAIAAIAAIAYSR